MHRLKMQQGWVRWMCRCVQMIAKIHQDKGLKFSIYQISLKFLSKTGLNQLLSAATESQKRLGKAPLGKLRKEYIFIQIKKLR